jgi:hypothetical protein
MNLAIILWLRRWEWLWKPSVSVLDVPLFKWRWNQVNWQIGTLPFGGYVKIAGMEFSKKDKFTYNDPYEVPNGFFPNLLGSESLSLWRVHAPILLWPFLFLQRCGSWEAGKNHLPNILKLLDG